MASDKHNDSPWFRHDTDADQDPKMERMIAFYGNAGVGVYWRLAQRLRAQGGRLRLVDIPVLAATLGFPDLEKLIEKACGEDWQLYHKDDSYFWSDRSVAEAQLAAQSRTKASESGRKGAIRRWHGGAMTPPTQPNSDPIAPPSGKDGTNQPTRPTDEEISSEENSHEPQPPFAGSSGTQDPPAVQLTQHFARRYTERTLRPWMPTETHYAKAAALLRECPDAEEAVDPYFDEPQWFTWDRKRNKGTLSFGGFCAHAPEILAAHSPPRAGPAARECPVCGCQVVGSMRSCGECGMDVGKFDDREAVEEHRRWRAERLATSKQSGPS